MEFLLHSYPGIGIQPKTLTGSVWNRVGATPVILGQVVMTDTLATQSESSKTQTNPGADDFPLNNVITPTALGMGGLLGVTTDPGYWFGVVTDLGSVGTGADNTKIGVTWQGRCKVLITTGTTGEYGKCLYAAAAATGVTTTAAAGNKALGRVEQDTTVTATPALCLWDGIAGFGSSGVTS